MKLPFWRTKAAVGPARIPTWATPWSSGEAPRSYEAQVRDAYVTNPVASRAIRLVSEGAGGAPLVSNPPGHRALDLLESAGFGASGPGLLETLAAQLLLHGNAYLEAATGPDGLPAALFALRPERVGADRIDVSIAAWRAGEVPSVPIVEVREA